MSRSHPIRHLLPVIVATVLSAPLAAQAAAPARAALPALDALGEGWVTLEPGGETSCALGAEFQFYVRAGDPTRLLVYLQGGGACFDAETCDPARQPSPYRPAIWPDFHPSQQGGILALDNPENPFAGHSVVVIPVCTGDAHLGIRDATYTLTDANGETREFTVRHRGQINVMTAFDWARANFAAPTEIFMAGSAAGAVGVAFHASMLARHYPAARVTALSDDAASYGRQAVPQITFASWGFPDALRRHSGWEAFDGSLGVDDFFILAAASAPNLRLFQVDHAYSVVQELYLALMAAEDRDVLNQIRATRKRIAAAVPHVRYFTIGGFTSGVLNYDFLYDYHTDGHRLRDWLAAIAGGEEVVSVDCTECLRPGLRYAESDLRLVERAIELLSAPGAWNPVDAGACAQDAERFSLRCATFQATQEVTGRRPMGFRHVPPAMWDILYSAEERTGPHPDMVRVRREKYREFHPGIRAFNNDPGTTAADVIGMLEEVRGRILVELAAN